MHPVSFYPQGKIEELEQITEQLRINNEITKKIALTLGLECRIRRAASPDLLYTFPFQVDNLAGQREYIKYMILELIRLNDSNA